MSKEDVKRALEAFGDPEVRAQFEDGDFSALGEHELTDEEQTLVSDAAADLPEVAGFASDYLLMIEGVKGESKAMKWPERYKVTSKVELAFNYASIKLH